MERMDYFYGPFLVLEDGARSDPGLWGSADGDPQRSADAGSADEQPAAHGAGAQRTTDRRAHNTTKRTGYTGKIIRQ